MQYKPAMPSTDARAATDAVSAPAPRRTTASMAAPLVLAVAALALPVSLPAQELNAPAAPRPVRGWPQLPDGDVCPSTGTALPGRENFLSIRKFSPVLPMEGCSARWNDGLYRHFFRGSPPSRAGVECLGTALGVNHIIDMRRTGEIRIDSRAGGIRSEEAVVTEFNARHPERPMHYFNVQTTRDTPSENERQLGNVVHYVQDALRDDPSAVFYVHCRAGRDRTGVVVAAIESLVGECPWPGVRRRLFSFHFGYNYVEPLLRPLEHLLHVGR